MQNNHTLNQRSDKSRKSGLYTQIHICSAELQILKRLTTLLIPVKSNHSWSWQHSATNYLFGKMMNVKKYYFFAVNMQNNHTLNQQSDESRKVIGSIYTNTYLHVYLWNHCLGQTPLTLLRSTIVFALRNIYDMIGKQLKHNIGCTSPQKQTNKRTNHITHWLRRETNYTYFFIRWKCHV